MLLCVLYLCIIVKKIDFNLPLYLYIALKYVSAYKNVEVKDLVHTLNIWYIWSNKARIINMQILISISTKNCGLMTAMWQTLLTEVASPSQYKNYLKKTPYKTIKNAYCNISQYA